MHRIICEDCKKSYDYAKDEFCPRCGAFNPPTKTWSTDSQGNIIRVDGVNESTHTGSFVHREVHREKTIRKITGMDRRPKSPNAQPSSTRRSAAMPPQMSPRAQRRAKYSDSVTLRLFLWFLGIMFFVSVVVPFLFALL